MFFAASERSSMLIDRKVGFVSHFSVVSMTLKN